MKYNKFIVLILGILSIASCIDAEMESVPVDILNPIPPVKDPDVVQFNAEISEAFTKVNLPYRTSKAVWEKGDKVAITDGTRTAIYEAYSGGSSATVLVHHSGDTLAIGNVLYKAYYPASVMTEGFPVIQKVEGFDKASDFPMTAEAFKDNPLKFSNICGLLRMDVTSEVGQVRLMEFSVISSTSFNEGFNLDCGKGVYITGVGEQVLPVFLPSGSYNDLKILYSGFKQDGEKETFIEGESYINQVVDIYPSAITDAPLILTAAPHDLSENQAANCYMVNRTGTYKFAAVKGCGDESLGDVASVEVLWETQLSNNAPKSGSMVSRCFYTMDGYINFTTGNVFIPGNVLIAAKDSNGKTVWSWHIWMVSEGIVSDLEYATGITVMNTCLGASDSKGKPGLLYQYGRKDPFTGSIGSSSPALVTPSSAAWTTDDRVVDVETSIQNPTVLYGVAKSAVPDWTTSEEDLWGASSEEKSIYDPCPPGYRVPMAGADMDMNENPDIKTSYWSGHVGNTFYTKPNHDSTLGNGVVDYYPRSGIIQNMVLSCSSTAVDMWTASRSLTDGKAYKFSFVNNAGISLVEASRYDCGIIRCQKIQ